MSTKKIIYWRPDLPRVDGNMRANIHLLVGYNRGTIRDFQSMANEMRKTFPQAEDSQIRCGRVQKSRIVEGFSIIAWDTHIPQGDYPGWEQIQNGQMEYQTDA